MKYLKIASMLPGAAVAFLFISCGGNGGGEKSSTDTTAASTDTSAATAKTETNTIVTTPQNMMVVTHKVADYAKWKVAYDGHDSARLADGMHSYVIGRGLDDSNMVLVALKVDDIAKAKSFAKDPGLKKAMQKGGVMGAPSISLVTMVFQDTANIDSKLRAKTMLKVKDWDAWKKSFDSVRQIKSDIGLMTRVYGYDVDDNHNVTLVSAITDTAKARAYYNSDLIKQRRAAAGVTGTPQRFMFRIVQRY